MAPSHSRTHMFAKQKGSIEWKESLLEIFVIDVCRAVQVKGHLAFWKLVSAKAAATLVMLIEH